MRIVRVEELFELFVFCFVIVLKFFRSQNIQLQIIGVLLVYNILNELGFL